jgi:hypothetical protein
VPLLNHPNASIFEESQHLGVGQFDEVGSHNSFLEALNAWRGAPSQIITTSTASAEKQFTSKKGN